MTGLLLVFNVGSSTVKIAGFDPAAPDTAVFRLRVELATGVVAGQGALPAGLAYFPPPVRPEDLLDVLLDRLRAAGLDLIAGAHRVVHGGSQHGPQWLNPALLAELEALEPLCPLHQPPALEVIHHLRRRRPGLAQLAVFDTAFHRDQPALATTYALPAELRAAGLHGYGFHGVSCQYLLRQLHTHHPEWAHQRLVLAHLGSGASLTAVYRGRSIATTMGFSTLDGLSMGTRCGHLDPGVLLYLLDQGWSKSRLVDLLYHRSGLLGLSGLSADIRTLLASDTDAARFAVDHFCYRVAREAASLAGALEGLDGLVFSGGIGEHQPAIRARILARLGWLGAHVDPDANAGDARVISPAGTPVRVLVVPTDEEQEICWQSLPLLARRRLAPVA